ncbi:MAG: MauE/DoxX family redox-associated membrane protein [Candidatus Ancaeobacter aquaticus]|nr:MauE/DoxX family redox-associated membrane protein [Candidatus Ancaeobacter aquaticus]
MKRFFVYASDPKSLISIIARIVIGGLFVYASIDKILYPAQFAEIINEFDLLSWELSVLSALWLSWLELFVGILLIFNVWARACALLLSGLCFLFILALISALVRGIELNCGCFTTKIDLEHIRTWGSLWIEVALLIGCVYVWIIDTVYDYNIKKV